jgi:hypothetical protein
MPELGTVGVWLAISVVIAFWVAIAWVATS